MQDRKDQNAKFRDIVESHQEKVRNTCFRFVNSPEDADDIAQEVFVQVFESMSRFREEAQLSTWIYQIAVNKSIDFIRKKKRKKRFALLTSIFKSGEDEEIIEIPSYNNPEKALEDKEQNELLDWAISKLPDNQKTAIILSKYEGFSNKEITKIMSLSLSSVESLIHRAKKNLHKQLSEYFEKKF